ncbi:hypothetical protein E2562_024558 [Oryza meyeriana var. granulata]|uniref:Uncharacterized protein n=1 Tax=Oryza meyeriana var. granulata TaxID=110450 RepID=A0A6G1BQ34_9ORYZ|nr:hypothetical protein E2562_024558 [Oryza meyeriana var. granulata]
MCSTLLLRSTPPAPGCRFVLLTALYCSTSHNVPDIIMEPTHALRSMGRHREHLPRQLRNQDHLSRSGIPEPSTRRHVRDGLLPASQEPRRFALGPRRTSLRPCPRPQPDPRAQSSLRHLGGAAAPSSFLFTFAIGEMRRPRNGASVDNDTALFVATPGQANSKNKGKTGKGGKGKNGGGGGNDRSGESCSCGGGDRSGGQKQTSPPPAGPWVLMAPSAFVPWAGPQPWAAS